MRMISFSLTTDQFLNGSKDVTRRFGWRTLKPGTRLQAVEKAMGLKKGEHVRKLGVIEVVSVRRESLMAVTADECRREGFPGWTPDQFRLMLTQHHKITSHHPEMADVEVTRIEFRKVEG